MEIFDHQCTRLVVCKVSGTLFDPNKCPNFVSHENAKLCSCALYSFAPLLERYLVLEVCYESLLFAKEDQLSDHMYYSSINSSVNTITYAITRFTFQFCWNFFKAGTFC